MPVPIYPDWRVVLARPEVRKAVRSGRGFQKLDQAYRPTAERLHRSLTKAKDGSPLSREERFKRIDLLTYRQVRAAKLILAQTLMQTMIEYEFQLLDGQQISFMHATTPVKVYEGIADLSIGVSGFTLTEDIKRDRPDIVIAALEFCAAEADKIAGNPKAFPDARELFAKDARKFRAQIADLRSRKPYAGGGRRAKLERRNVSHFVDGLVQWLQERPQAFKAKQPGAQARLCSELLTHARQVSEEGSYRIEDVPKDQVQEILYGRGRTTIRGRVVELAALAFDASKDTIRKLAKTGPRKSG